MSMDVIKGGGTVERILKVHIALNKIDKVNSRILSIVSGKDSDVDLPENEITLLPCLNRRWYLPVPKLSIVKKILEWADVVHITNHWTIINAWVYFLVKRMNKPYVICPAGSLTIFGRSLLIKKIYHFIIGHRLIKNASAGIAVSKDEINLLIKNGLKSHLIHHLPNGVNQSDFKYNEPFLFKNAAGIKHSEPYILFVGRLNEIKAPDILLDAFISIKDYIKHHLVYVGPDEGMKPLLEKKVKEKNLIHRVHFFGFAEGELKSSAYYGTDLLVVPSRHEAMSIVALEAAITATPVLLTNQCGFSSLVNAGGGIEVAPTIEGIKTGLQKLLVLSSDLKTMGENGKKLIQKKYTWEIIANKHLDVFSKVISSNNNA